MIVGMTTHDPDAEWIDDEDTALLIRARFSGDVKIASQLTPDKTAELLRRIANNIEGNAPDGTMIASRNE